MRIRALLLVAVLASSLATVACKDAGTKATPPDTAQTTRTPAAEAPEPPAAPPALDETSVRARIDAWLAAQNGGDFTGYQQLYADKMEGVKRVGARLWRFDRASWMTDRQRMFRHPMKVEAADVGVRITGSMATVTLIQTFQQGKFRDQGPKQIVLVATPSGPSIAREEMLASTRVPPAAGIDSATGVRFVIEIEKRPYLVIGRADETWGSGRSRGPLASDMAQYVALRPASGAPAAAKAWLGRTITLYGASGTCDGLVQELAVAAGGTPHAAVEARWAGDPEFSDTGKPMSKTQQADEILGLSDLLLVGALAVPAGCAPLYAAGGRAPTTFPAAATLDDATRDRAIAAFRVLPAYQALQREFEADFEGKGPWTASPAVHMYANDTRTFVSVEASEGEGCGSWNGALWALFELAEGALVLVNDPARSGYSPHALLDADGDGTVEIIGHARTLDGGLWYVTVTPGEPIVNAEIRFPFTDCGC